MIQFWQKQHRRQQTTLVLAQLARKIGQSGFPKPNGLILTYFGKKPIKQIYRLKSEIVDEWASKMDLDAEKPIEKVIKIGSIDVPIKEDG